MSDAMREKIAKLIYMDGYPIEKNEARAAADAIIAALPGMVPPLEWDGVRANIGGGCYYHSLPSISGKTWCVSFVFRGGSHTLGYETSLEGGHATAQAHHAAQIMQALGIEKEIK